MGRARRRAISTRPPIQRMHWLHEQLRKNRFPNATEAMAQFEITRRTFFRDLEYMRLMLGAPIAYDRARKGYYYTSPTFNLSAVQLREGELFALLVAEKALHQYRGTPYETRLTQAFKKICQALSESVTVDLRHADGWLSFDIGPIRAPEMEIYETFCKALGERRAVRMRYHTQSRDEDTERVVEPYHLHNHKGDWYLVAFCHMRNRVRDFLLSRVLSADILDETFVPPDDFDFARYAADSFDVEKGGKPVKVKIRFDAYEARWIRERQWHPTQRIREHRDGSMTIEFQASGLDEVARWALSYGEHAVVLQPKRLKRQVIETLRQSVRNYQKKM